MDDIDQRFLVTSMYICPFEITDDRFVVQKEGYPTRLCVIDNEQNIAIDICHGLKYDYVKIMSGLHFVSNYSDKIKSQKRLAVFPQQLVCLDEQTKEKALKIEKKLINGIKFKDGNDVLTNEEYLNCIKEQSSDKVLFYGKKLLK